MKVKLCFFKKKVAANFAFAFCIKANYGTRIRVPGYQNIIAFYTMCITAFSLHISGIYIAEFLFSQALKVAYR